jgi:3'5'-cyclic nucleotide phosphodiesterase
MQDGGAANIFKHLTRPQYQEARKLVVRTILATDMSQHMEQCARATKLLYRAKQLRAAAALTAAAAAAATTATAGRASGALTLSLSLGLPVPLQGSANAPSPSSCRRSHYSGSRNVALTLLSLQRGTSSTPATNLDSAGGTQRESFRNNVGSEIVSNANAAVAAAAAAAAAGGVTAGAAGTTPTAAAASQKAGTRPATPSGPDSVELSKCNSSAAHSPTGAAAAAAAGDASLEHDASFSEPEEGSDSSSSREETEPRCKRGSGSCATSSTRTSSTRTSSRRSSRQHSTASPQSQSLSPTAAAAATAAQQQQLQQRRAATEPAAHLIGDSVEDRLSLLELLVHSCDLSGQVMATHLALEWGRLILQEFKNQVCAQYTFVLLIQQVL